MAKKTKAYAIHSVYYEKDGKEVLAEASTKDRPNIFELDNDNFKKLMKAGAVRVPTNSEIAVYEARVKRENGGVEDEEDEDQGDLDLGAGNEGTVDGASESDGKSPDGSADLKTDAKGDPKAAPKGKGSKLKDDDI
jgi:hypothetical protein